MKPETVKAIELAKYLQATHVTSDPRAAEVIDDLADAVLDLVDEIEKLKKVLLESPAAAEMMKQLPNAMRLRTKETDDLRAALLEACDIGISRGADERDPTPWVEADRLRELRKLAE